METQNITLAIPKRVLRKFKELAFRRQKSVSGLMVEIMEKAVSQEEGYEIARDRFLHRMNDGTDLQTYGQSGWKREDLHDR